MFLKKVKRAGQKAKSYRVGSAIVLSLLALVVAIGVVGASGPMQPPHPPTGGMWEMPSRAWWPMAPVPEIEIVAVEKNVNVTFETENFPENEDFVVTMGYIYTRGKEGIEVGAFNSGTGESQQLSFAIPQELADEYRLAVRAQTAQSFPYYAFNWFYNNSANGTATNSATEATSDEAPATETAASETSSDSVEETEAAADSTAATEQTALAPVETDDVEEAEETPSFEICIVKKDSRVDFQTNNFPADKVFTVKMGVMPETPKPDPYHNGKMISMPQGEMNMEMPMQQHDSKPGHPMPPLHPPGKDKPMQSPKIWIPYYEAGTFETNENGDIFTGFEIPAELAGAYRISIMMYSDDAYPYYAYNWFYNNDASVCEP